MYTPCVELDEKRARTPTVTGGSVTARARPPAAAQYILTTTVPNSKLSTRAASCEWRSAVLH